MKPSETAETLRKIAAAIDNSKNPDRRMVAADLKRVLAAVEEEPAPPAPAKPEGA